MSTSGFYFVNSFFVRLFGLEEGQVLPNKPRLVFLHGLLGNGQNWLPVARALEEKFTILLIDQRGHGKTQEVKGDFGPQDFSEDLLGVLFELGWEKASFVGHSLGGRTLFYFASHFPERVEKVVIEDMGPHKTGAVSQGTEEMIQSIPAPFKSREAAKVFFEGRFREQKGKVLSDYMYSNLEKKENGSYDWRFNKAGALRALEIGREQDFWKDYDAIEAPLLIVRGSESEHLPKNIYESMLERNHHAQGIEIPGAGHWVHFDQSEAFIKSLLEFLLGEV